MKYHVEYIPVGGMGVVDPMALAQELEMGLMQVGSGRRVEVQLVQLLPVAGGYLAVFEEK